MKRAESGSAIQAPHMFPGGGKDPESRASVPKRPPRKDSGVSGPSWVPRASRKCTVSLRPAQGCRGTLHVPTWPPWLTLVVHIHVQTEATDVSNSGLAIALWLSRLALVLSPYPFLKGFEIKAQDATYMYDTCTLYTDAYTVYALACPKYL